MTVISQRFTHKYLLCILLAFSLVGVAQFISTPHAHAAAKSAAWLAANVPNAQATIEQLESNCSTSLANNRAAGLTGRNLVNSSAYWGMTWLTQAGDPNNNMSNSIPPGTTSINMQVNQMDFLCAIVTMPASQTTSPLPSSQVTATQYPNDRGPVPDIGGAPYDPNQASKYEHNSIIDNAIVVAGGGSIAPGIAGKKLSYARDNASRYWPALPGYGANSTGPVPFTYRTAQPLTPGLHVVTVQVFYRYIDTYHAYGAAGTSRCVTAGGGATIPYNDFSPCLEVSTTYSFTFNVQQPQVQCSGTTQTLSPTPYAQPGDSTTLRLAWNVPTTQLVIDSVTSNIPPYLPVTIPGLTPGATYNSVAAFSFKDFTFPAPSAQAYTVKWHVITALGNCTGGLSIVQLPYFKAYGSGVLAGGEFKSINPGCDGGGELAGWFDDKTRAGYSYGSSSQLNALALLKIYGFGSAQTSTARVPSALSFANQAADWTPDNFTPSVGGNFDSNPGNYTHCLTEPQQLTGAAGVGTSVDLNTGMDGAYHGAINKDLMINPGGNAQIGVGKNVSIFVNNGDVYIRHNITYDTSIPWNISNMPSFILVATGNIYIDPAVTELDGLYVARNVDAGSNVGQIYTCATPSVTNIADPMPAGDIFSKCNTQLTVYGSFVADQVNLMRSFGTLRDERAGPSAVCSNAGARSSTRVTCAAEVFDFSPEIYLSNPAIQPPANGAIQYDSITSLPPVL